MAGLTWDGNQTVFDGETIYILAHAGQFTANYKAAIDGFSLTGGDQMGFPNNINQIGGGPTGLPANAVTQGGAIFANAYAQYLQITNNVVQNNGGAYGTIRLGTPNLPQPETNQHNENVRIANNRIIANGGTNLPGVGAVQDEDILYLNAGNWSLYFDGTAAGLGESNNEDVDAFDILPDNSLVVSTSGNNVAVPGLAGTYQNRDLLRCAPTNSGPITGCTWSFYFDGSDVALGSSTSENITGAAVKNGNIYLTTAGNFSVAGLSGNNEDVFICNSPTTGANSSCGSFTMFFDGSVSGMGGSLDAISLP